MSDIYFDTAEQLVKKIGSRDPFDALDYLKVKVKYTDRHLVTGLKGFCMVALQTRYVMINGNMDEADWPIIAAHELGHIRLHTDDTRAFTFKEDILCSKASKMEREANLFGINFLIPDCDMTDCIISYQGDMFKIASELRVPPDFLTFKLFSMIQRGYSLRLPLDMDNRFLAKDMHRLS